VTSASAGLFRDLSHRAEGNASLTVALIWLLLVPLPALLVTAGPRASQVGVAWALHVLGQIAAASPLFAVAPFVMGCGIGTLLYLVLTAPARFAAIRAEREVRIGARSLVAMSLLVGGTFAAAGLLAGIALT
jgi:hypothetical protein